MLDVQENTVFLVFGGDSYYPDGGVNEIVAICSTLDDMIAALPTNRDWVHVLQIEDDHAVVVWTQGLDHLFVCTLDL